MAVGKPVHDSDPSTVLRLNCITCHFSTRIVYPICLIQVDADLPRSQPNVYYEITTDTIYVRGLTKWSHGWVFPLEYVIHKSAVKWDTAGVRTPEAKTVVNELTWAHGALYEQFDRARAARLDASKWPPRATILLGFVTFKDKDCAGTIISLASCGKGAQPSRIESGGAIGRETQETAGSCA